MNTNDIHVRIPFVTLLKVALFALLLYGVIRLRGVIAMIVVAVLLAVMLDALVGFLERHRVRRGLGIALAGTAIFGVLVALVVFVVPLMSREVADLARSLPRGLQEIGARFPAAAPVMRGILNSAVRVPAGSQLHSWLSRGLTAGLYAVEAVGVAIFILVVALYLVIEGRTAYAWLVSFAPPQQRLKVAQTAEEVSGVILAYVRGQLINCTLCGSWSLLVLTLLGVPAAVPLAVLAFFFDVLPVIGTIIMSVPATLLALTVSPTRALLVIVAYLFYHVAESYVIIPRVYGNEMRLSTLTVLLAITVGGTLMGVVGAVLILPFVAAYPIVERIWLRDRLPADTVARHEAL